MAQGVLYIIGKLLELRCLKWACIAHLNIYTQVMAKRRAGGSNWQFDSQPLKVGNRPDFIVCRWCATRRWKDLDEGYNFALDLILIQGLHVKLWGPKIAGVPTLAILGLPFGSLGTKSNLDVVPVGSHIVYYKGESGGFPQVRAVVSLVSPNCLWLILAPKVLQQCTNQLVAWFCVGPCE